jgi:hypothetical protein
MVRASYVNRDASIKFATKELLEGLWIKQSGCCYYCGVEMEKHSSCRAKAEIDHVIPGLDEPDNLVWSCRYCNKMKSNHTIETLQHFTDKIKRFLGKQNECI